MKKKSKRRAAIKRIRQTKKRIDKANWNGQSPMIHTPDIKLEIAERNQAISHGGLATIQQLVRQIGLADLINKHCPILKLYLPFSEADHVLNIAFNLLAGGNCLEHIEHRRNDPAFLDALDAQRIPDPTTAGDFCRRFSHQDVLNLQHAFNQARLKVWRQQPDEFLDTAVIEADGTIVETAAEKKAGIGLSYKGQWGYHPLVVTLANTREVLFLENRSGNRPSHENAAGYYDRAAHLCREAGFRNILFKGDTDFSQTTELDRWDDAGYQFVFGIDAMPNLVSLAEAIPEDQWRLLDRKKNKQEAASEGERSAGKSRTKRPIIRRRSKRVNSKEEFVVAKGYENKRLEREFVAEFPYCPTACDRDYRVVVVWKELSIHRGQLHLFDDVKCFFYITNQPKTVPAAAVVRQANQRCDQENIIAQLKSFGALSVPLHDLVSNEAYMVMASLAWNLKSWLGLSLSESCEADEGEPTEGEERRLTKRRIVRMDFATFRQELISIPAQIVRSGRQLIYRFLTVVPGVLTLLSLHESVSGRLLE